MATNNRPSIEISYPEWFQVFRGVARPTDERTLISTNLKAAASGNSAPVIDFDSVRAIASTLVLGNMNSLPLDWAARFSVGGSNMNYFIVKQLPVLPPERYLQQIEIRGQSVVWAQLVVPRVLELTYTAIDLRSFALDLGYEGPPFAWDEDRRHRLKSELDAIYAHMYGLERDELDWILDAPPPSSSFPTLKRTEISEFGEYRTGRYVLAAYDALRRSEFPDLDAIGA